MSFLKTILSTFVGGIKKESEVEAPKFILSETAEKYRQVLAEKMGAYNASKLRYIAKKEVFFAQAKETEEQAGTPAQREINRREAEKIRQQAHEVHWPGRILSDQPEEYLARQAEQVSRADEEEKIAFEGKILSSEKEEDVDSERNHFSVRERRVVEFRGNYYLLFLEYQEVTRGTGKVEVRHTGDGYRGHHTDVWPVLERTGDYGPPEVTKITDDLGRFTDEELRAIA